MAIGMGSSAVSAAAAIAGLFPLSPPRLSISSSISVSISSLKLGLGRPLAFQQLLWIHPLNFKTKSTTTTTLSSVFPCPSRPRLFCSSPPPPPPPASAAAALHLKHQQFQLDDDDDEFQKEREMAEDAQGAAPSEPNIKVIIEEEEDKLAASHSHSQEEENEKEVISRRIIPTPKTSLSVKERKELASFAHSLGKKLKSQQVGKSGVTPSVATSFLETLEANELLKLKIHGSCPGELDDVIKQLEEATGSVAVDQIGRTVILYRPSLSKMKMREAASSRKPKEYPMAFKMQKKAQAPRVSGEGRHQLRRS